MAERRSVVEAGEVSSGGEGEGNDVEKKED